MIQGGVPGTRVEAGWDGGYSDWPGGGVQAVSWGQPQVKTRASGLLASPRGHHWDLNDR